MKENTETLEKVMSPEQVGSLRAIVEEGMRTNRTINAMKLKGGSDTNQRINAAAKTAPSNMARMTMEVAAGEAGSTIGAFLGGGPGAALGGLLGWGGPKLVNSLHGAGLNNLNRIRFRAAMDPTFARPLLDEVPKQPGRNSLALLALRAKQIGLAAGLSGARQNSQ
jgi:hypothetical protein